MASPQFPEPPSSVPATPLEEIDRTVERLYANKDQWVHVGVPSRIQLLEECIEKTVEISEQWVDAVCRAKGINPTSESQGEAWFSGPVTTIRNMRLLIESLKANGQPRPPKITTRSNGQVVARVFPANVYDRVLFTGFTADVWIKPGYSATQGKIYRQKQYGEFPEGKVSLVLGAGNVTSIAPMDILYKLFVEDEVVILKTNPVNAYVGQYIEHAMAPLIKRGFMGIAHGGAEAGKHLCNHKQVDTIHITGSNRTHDAIVWGGTERTQKSRKKKNEPVNRRPITSELGCVTPIFVVPGPWSSDDLDFQAEHVAAMVAHNASFNCNAGKVLVTAKGWPLHDEFIHRVKKALANTPPRKAYYPGAHDRYEGFLKAYPDAVVLGQTGEEIVPWTLLPTVPPKKGEYALTNEAFCGVLANCQIDARDPDEFLAKISTFANDVVWGTLSCSILIHGDTEKQFSGAFDQFISGLRYGGIAINLWPGVIYGLVVSTWGAHPGHTLDDIQSGIGVVHNSYLFDHPQKSVVRAPFRIRPTPVWFPNHKTVSKVGRAMTKFEASPSLLNLPRVVFPALRG